jgi:hypothetical protein
LQEECVGVETLAVLFLEYEQQRRTLMTPHRGDIGKVGARQACEQYCVDQNHEPSHNNEVVMEVGVLLYDKNSSSKDLVLLNTCQGGVGWQ